MLPRTDLAMEAKELFERSAGEQTRLSGVLARETDRRGVRMTLVRILDAEGEQALGKPRGTYITAELDALARGARGFMARKVSNIRLLTSGLEIQLKWSGLYERLFIQMIASPA